MSVLDKSTAGGVGVATSGLDAGSAWLGYEARVKES